MLVKELEKSEKTNKVYKQNAGAAQENVKHSKNLVMKLNNLISPQFAKKLIKLHDNSDIEQLIS